MLAPIDGYPNYLVSDYGEVINTKTGKSLIAYRVGEGYLRVDLRHKGKRRQVAVHQLVAECFIPNEEGKTQVNHRDGDKMNNKYTNLEWCTPKENMQHAKQNGLLNGKPVTIEMISLKDGGSKIYPSIAALARRLNKSSDTVRYILAGSLRGIHGFTLERITEKKSPEGQIN